MRSTREDAQGRPGKKVSPSRVRRTLSRNFTKGKPGGVECVDHRLPLTGACTFFEIRDGAKTFQNTQLVQFTRTSHAAFDFHECTLGFKGDSLMGICIQKDQMLGVLLIRVERGPLSE